MLHLNSVLPPRGTNDGYWRDVLQDFGAVPAEKNLALRELLITTLRKRLNQNWSTWFETEEQIERLGRELSWKDAAARAEYIDHSPEKNHSSGISSSIRSRATMRMMQMYATLHA